MSKTPDDDYVTILQYLEELVFFISTTHVDMGGRHKYVLRPSGYPLVTEIKAWLAERGDDVRQNPTGSTQVQ